MLEFALLLFILLYPAKYFKNGVNSGNCDLEWHSWLYTPAPNPTAFHCSAFREKHGYRRSGHHAYYLLRYSAGVLEVISAEVQSGLYVTTSGLPALTIINSPGWKNMAHASSQRKLSYNSIRILNPSNKLASIKNSPWLTSSPNYNNASVSQGTILHSIIRSFSNHPSMPSLKDTPTLIHMHCNRLHSWKNLPNKSQFRTYIN